MSPTDGRAGAGESWSIDVVIPTYNRAELVAKAIESALAQSRRPDAVIVVDDGSTDGTAGAVAAFGPSVSYLVVPHRGVAAARNAGVESSDADFIALLDSDDSWDPGHLERVERAIDATSGEACLYFSDLRLGAGRDAAASIWRACSFGIERDHELRSDATAWGLLPRQPMMTTASVVSREAYRKLGGQAENLISREDTHLFTNLCLSGPACAVAGIAGEARAGDAESLSQRELNSLSYWQNTRWLYADLLARYGDLPPADAAVLRRRLAEADWQLARGLFARRPFEALSHLARAARDDHRVVAEHCRSLGSRLFGLPRASSADGRPS